MYQHPTRARFWGQLWQRDTRAFNHLLTPDLIQQAAADAGLTPAASPLNLFQLVWLAVACAWHGRHSFAGVLTLAFKLLADLAAGPPPPTLPPPTRRRRHDPRVAADAPPTEEAFCQARQRLPWNFWLALSRRLADRFAQQHAQLVRWRGRYRLLCLDGSTLDLPNWPDLAKAFGTAGRGVGRRQAQARLVLLQLTAARMPWRWDLVPLAQSEQEVAARLLTAVAADDLVLMDRGFWSYRLFWQLQNRQAFFAIRLRKQIKYQHLGALGPGDDLVCWQPRSAAARKAIREEELPESIRLRVITYQVAGFRPSAVVTNVLDPQAVPAAEFVRQAVAEQGRRLVAAGLYHRRWEIETTFYELKVTQELEGGLRSRSAAGVRYEVAGHLLLYQLLRWLLVEAAARAGEADPLRLSYQEALRDLSELRPALLKAGPRRVGLLVERLLQRVGGHVVPSRPGRHYRRPHDTKAKAKGGGRYQPACKLEAAADGAQGAPDPEPARQQPLVA
jgi:hypothetical protein